MDTPEPSRHAIELPSAPRRAVVIVIAVLLAIHSFLVMIWVMPTNPFRDAVGNEFVSSYVNNKVFPFEQSWSVFAPTPRRGGENVQVRAYLGDPVDAKVTDWYDITANEDGRIKYLVNPSRFHSATRRLGGNINGLVVKFSDAQRQVVRGGFVETSRSELADLLVRGNTRGPQGRVDIATYLRNDEMLTRFGTMYATALWGKDVSAVEFRVGHRSVPNYSKRNEVDFLDVPFSYYRIGPRKALPGNRDAQAAFDAYVDDAPAGSATTGDGQP